MAECSSQRVLITAVVVLSIITLALVIVAGVFIWRETREEEKLKLTSENLQKTYISNFRTSSQQELFARQYMSGIDDRQVVKDRIPSLNGTCRFSCLKNNNVPARRRRQVALWAVYHGCCVSSVQFVSPTTKLNIFGENRTLVQLDDLRQYFAERLCQYVDGCSGCVCSQENNLYTAVVLKTSIIEAEFIDDTETDFFFFPGCCKCINN